MCPDLYATFHLILIQPQGYKRAPNLNSSSAALTMLVSLKNIAILALMTGAATVDAQQKTGKTTRYWDCCKGSCGWQGKASVNQPITSCDKNDNPLQNMGAKNACENGGQAYMCTNQVWSDV